MKEKDKGVDVEHRVSKFKRDLRRQKEMKHAKEKGSKCGLPFIVSMGSQYVHS